MTTQLRDFILGFCFRVSRLPMLYHELLKANKQLNNNMSLKGIDMGIKLRYGRTYLLFFGLIHIVIIPLAYIAHFAFAKVDCHLSIVFAIVLTTIVFSFFGLFKEWLYDKMIAKSIYSNWQIHFSYFKYDKYRYDVEKYYTQAILDGVEKNSLESYITDQLTSNAK